MSLTAEKCVRRYKHPEWSVELDQARKKVSILAKALTMMKTNIDHTSIIRTELSRLKEPILIPESLTEGSTALKRAKREVEEIVQRSYATRTSERDRQIAQLEADVAESRNKTKIRILKQLKKAEAIKQMFQKLQFLRNKHSRSGISRIEVPERPDDDPRTCTRWKIIDIPTEILHHLQLRNRKHFGQAHGSPFTVSPLIDDLTFTGDTSTAEVILNGEYNAAHLDDSVQLLIKQLRQTEYAQQHSIQPTISEHDYASKIKSWRESTSTSPSGLHLGHYKAMFARHQYSDCIDSDPNKRDIEEMQQQIVELHLCLLNYALTRGYTYRRWCQVANAMLFKEPGNIKIHRTRVIHIYEADYNLAMGLKWREALYYAEQHKSLNAGQYGSRPSRGAHDPVFLEEMQLEISRLTRKSLVQINYDATSCYDRIIPNLAGLVARKFGVPQPAVLTNNSTLQHAAYRLKTELGTSAEAYSHNPPGWPIYGTGQGSGNSPVIWCFLSSVLFDAYVTKATGATYEMPDRSSTLRIHMIGYVDDSNGQTNLFCHDSQPTLEQILTRAQRDAQSWCDLLTASGGALEISKCTYHAIQWTFSTDGSPFGQGITPSKGITIQSTNGSPECCLLELSAHTSHKTLGHYKDPMGNQQKQFDVLMEKSNRAAEFVARSFLTREEAWTYYFAIYLPSVGFPLPNSHFTLRQLDNIQRKFMSILFAKCGFNRNTKREILYGPARLGGANFRTLYSVQGAGQVTTFLRFWRSPCQAGQLLRIAVAWAQYAAGISTPILENTKIDLPHLESKWLQSLRKYLTSVRGQIEVDNATVPAKERAHDWHIMDAVLQSGMFTANDIKQVNYCRLYLQVVTISDVATARGDKLDPYMIRGVVNHSTSSVTKWHAFHQDRPPESAWKLWRQANSLWSNRDGTLKQKLGPWTVPSNKARRHWQAYCNSDQSMLYFRQSTTPLRYVGYTLGGPWQSPTTVHLHTYTMPETQISADAIPIDVDINRDGQRSVTFTRCDHDRLRRQSVMARAGGRRPAITSFNAFIRQLDDWEYDLLQNTRFTHDEYTTFDLLSQGFQASSDGSVNHNKGAFGWSIATNNGERLIEAAGPARGRRMTSYRAEGYGILSVLRLLNRLREYCDREQQWNWVLRCDNEGLVNKVVGATTCASSTGFLDGTEVHDWTHWSDVMANETEEDDNRRDAEGTTLTNTSLEADWDLLNEIRWNFRASGLSGGRLEHIRGHQDDHKDYHSLSLGAQLNVDADRLAGDYQTHMDQPELRVLLFPHAGAVLHLQDGTCTTNIPKALRSAANELPLAQYICRRNKWDEHVFDSIDWEAHHRAIKRSNHKRIRIIKLIHDMVPTHNIVHRDAPQRQHCQGCKTGIVEDRDHVVQCQHADRAAWRAQAVARLDKRCVSMNSDPILTQILVGGFHDWVHGRAFQWKGPRDLPPKYHRLIWEQHQIGWRQLFNGRLSSEWGRLQADYVYIRNMRQRDMNNSRRLSAHTRTHSDSTGAQWTSRIIEEIWLLWDEVWTIRNTMVHGKDKESRSKRQQEKDEYRLRNIYDNRHNLEPSVQRLLYDNIDEHRNHSSPQAIHHWLSVHEATFLGSMKNVTKRAIQGVRSIQSYFATGRPPGRSTTGATTTSESQ